MAEPGGTAPNEEDGVANQFQLTSDHRLTDYDYFNVHSKADRCHLIYRTGPKTKTSKNEKTKKQTDMLRRNGARQETMESVRKREGSLGWKW